MRERPILFSALMVRAILDGRKSQTRRVLRDQNPVDLGVSMHGAHLSRRPVFDKVAQRVIGHRMAPVLCPYGHPGDRLWVREAWTTHSCFDGIPPRDLTTSSIHYCADGDIQTGKRRPGMFMPRRASRITLAVESVRVERLQDISEADSIAEGAAGHPDGPWHAYRSLWSLINGAGSWEANPLVWVVAFRRMHG